MSTKNWGIIDSALENMQPGEKYSGVKWTDAMRDQILRMATLNDVEGTQGKKRIVWINDRPYVLK